jgi:hypothetical protein
MSPPRIVALMGSGETAPTMAKVHRRLAAMLDGRPSAVLLSTPYAFQENAAEITSRTLDYFATNVGLPMTAVDVDGAGSEVAVGRAQSTARIAEADLVFSGPGSPSYALGRWHEAGLGPVLSARLGVQGILTFASAAALTIGSHTVPVYEIYKVGADPYWLAGLDVLGTLGLRVAVVPHYDNAEGGTHDTRFCYLGERRLARLEGELPDDTFVLGIDSHTALLLDLEAGRATVEGAGGVTVRAAGRSRVIPRGGAEAIADLPSIAADLRHAGRRAATTSPTLHEPTEPDLPVEAVASPLAADLDQVSRRVEAAIASTDPGAILAALIEMDELLAGWAADTDGTGELAEARHVYHAFLARALAPPGDGHRRRPTISDEVVSVLMESRARAREQHDYAMSDRIRDALASAGIEVRDSPSGSTWQPLER